MVLSELTDVDKKLDELSFRMLELMKEYIQLKLDVENSIKEGSLHLAKSRYIMGNRSVSVLQLPTEDSELQAGVRVTTSDIDKISFDLSRVTLTDREEDGVKRRGRSDSTQPDQVQPEKQAFGQDPMKWFGLLVPQNMKLAQSSFNRSLEIAVQCANVQLEMDSVLKSYEEALTQKDKLSASTS